MRRDLPVFVGVFALAGVGCGGNQAPRFLRVNGVAVERDLTGQQWVDAEFPFTPGESQVITVELFDPEGDPVDLWFPKAPPGLRFEPENRSGTWDVPDDFSANWWEIVIIAEDLGDTPAASTLELYYYAVNPSEAEETR